MRIISFLCCYLLSLPTFAIYDLASINITPGPQGTTFCFLLDTTEKQMYLALTISHQDFLFLSSTATGMLNFTAWQPPTAPPVFLQRKIRPDCFGPFPTETLQDVQLYVGVGDSFSDILEHQQYLKIFDGVPTLTVEEQPWTVMVYQVGSSLEREVPPMGSSPEAVAKTTGNASKDILEMVAGMQLPENRNLNLVIATGGSSREGWKTVKYSLIRDGQLDVLQDLGSQTMSAPQTLSNFVVWATDNFPAQHNALILWNHGGGTQGFGQDTSTGPTSPMMSLSQLHQAFQTIRTELDKPIDLVVYDACVMASIEVAEITATVANVMAGSAEIEPAHGIDYTYLLHQLSTTLPTEGIAVGKIVKEGYIQQTKALGTFNYSQITYSVLDLTQLPTLREAFSRFTEELRKNFDDDTFLTYKALSQGIIRAPGYPVKETGKLLRSLDEKKNIRVDFYNVLQTFVSPEFPQLKSDAEDLQASLQRLVVDYEANDKVTAIDPEAGRISIDLGSEHSYLSVLPAAYTQFNQALDYYNQRRQEDTFQPSGEFVCPGGMVCAEAKWWELPAKEVLSIDGYYSIQTDSGEDVYLIKPLYRYQPLAESLEIGVRGQEACQYQLCVSDTECSNLTVTESQGLWLADVVYNEMPAILTLCPDDQTHWQACSVLPQSANLWGRDASLSKGDTLTPLVLHLQEDELTSQPSQSLVVGETVPVIKPVCDMEKAVITASYFGNNQQPQFERLCDKGDCVCQADDQDESCLATHFQFKAGVRVRVK